MRRTLPSHWPPSGDSTAMALLRCVRRVRRAAPPRARGTSDGDRLFAGAEANAHRLRKEGGLARGERVVWGAPDAPAVVREDRVGGRDGAGPRIRAERPTARERGEAVAFVGTFVVGLPRALGREEQAEAELVAFELPCLANAELRRRLRDERAVREAE